MSLILSLSGITATLTTATTFQEVRTVIRARELSYTAAGTSVMNGISYESKHLWTGIFLLDPGAEDSTATKDALERIWVLQDAGARSGAAISTYEMLIQDRTKRFREPSPRTRAIVSGDTAIAVPPSPASPVLVEYYAQFRGVFVEAPQFETVGDADRWTVQLSITETSKVAA